jgi:hypothetical protein
MNYSQNYNDWRIIVVGNQDLRPLLLGFANSITNNNLWGWIKVYNAPKGYTFCNCKNKNISKIKNNLKKNKQTLKINCINHNTFNYCMKQMQLIALGGFDNWNNV